MNTQDLVEGAALFCLFKGDPGTGKSIAAHSFPQPSFTFDLDRKMASIKNFYPDQNFEFGRYDSLIDINNQMEAFRRRCPYQTLIFDSITNYSQLAMKCMIEYRNPGSKSKTVRAGIPMAEVEDYGGETSAINMVLDHLKAINIQQNVNVVITAHVLTVEHTAVGGKITNVSRTLVTAGKKIAAVIPTMFDEAYHFDVMASMDPSKAKPDYMVHTRHAGVDWARTSFNIDSTFEWTDRNFYEILSKKIKKDISL